MLIVSLVSYHCVMIIPQFRSEEKLNGCRSDLQDAEAACHALDIDTAELKDNVLCMSHSLFKYVFAIELSMWSQC